MEKQHKDLRKNKEKTTSICVNNLSRNIKPKVDEYYLASMFPNEDIMHRVYSIIRNLQHTPTRDYRV